jgi:hypothetical protein
MDFRQAIFGVACSTSYSMEVRLKSRLQAVASMKSTKLWIGMVTQRLTADIPKSQVVGRGPSLS